MAKRIIKARPVIGDLMMSGLQQIKKQGKASSAADMREALMPSLEGTSNAAAVPAQSEKAAGGPPNYDKLGQMLGEYIKAKTSPQEVPSQQFEEDDQDFAQEMQAEPQELPSQKRPSAPRFEAAGIGAPVADREFMQEAKTSLQDLPPQAKFADQEPRAPFVEIGAAKARQEKIDQENAHNADQFPKTVQPTYFQELEQDPMQKAMAGKIIGTDYDQEMADDLAKYQNVINAQVSAYGASIDSLSKEEAAIKQRLDSGNLTSKDQIMLGLTIFLPMILGGIFGGTEGALAAAGGAAGAVGEGLTQKMNSAREDEQRLSELAVEKANLEKAKAEAALSPRKYQLDLTDKLRKRDKGTPSQLFKGRKTLTVQDPQTGEETTGIELAKDLYADANYVQSEHDKNEKQKAAVELAKQNQQAVELSKITEEVIHLAQQLDDPSLLTKAWRNLLNHKNPDLSPTLGKTVELDGKKVNSAVALGGRLARLNDLYRQVVGMPRLTENVKGHVQDLILNPSASFASPQDFIDQMDFLRNAMQEHVIGDAASQNFLIEPLQSRFLQSRHLETARKGTQREVQRSNQILGNRYGD